VTLVGALPSAARAQGAGEGTFDRVRRTKALRIAALPGELPYFQKDAAVSEHAAGTGL
jgi:polar amino acid transport system substrate-binding protein